MRVLLLLSFLLKFSFLFAASDNYREQFLLNHEKPYVYIMFDHLGTREPFYSNESNRGLWLKLVNNCRIPINIAAFDSGKRDAGIGVLHDVVPLRTPTHGIMGNAKENTEIKYQNKQIDAPVGYSRDVRSLITINPGESVLFSVPFEHVNPRWYLQVHFTFDLSDDYKYDNPDSYVKFFWNNLPEEVRK
jgi:hypothetical protein